MLQFKQVDRLLATAIDGLSAGITMPAMEMPTPNEHHQKLAALAGDWHGREKMFPSPWDPHGSEADARSRLRVVNNGFNVVVDYSQSKQGEVVYSGHGVYSIDPNSHDVVLHWFDVIGGQCEEFRGRWQGEVLTLQSKNAMGHMRLCYDYSEAGKLKHHASMSPDGEQWNAMFEGEMTRAG